MAKDSNGNLVMKLYERTAFAQQLQRGWSFNRSRIGVCVNKSVSGKVKHALNNECWSDVAYIERFVLVFKESCH